MKIVCLEGCSGSGKTTQFHLLNDYFSRTSYHYIIVVEKDYEPFKTEVRKWHKEKGPSIPFIKEDIERFAKARVESFGRNFKNLDADLMIMDRYFYTSAVYQANLNISPEEILKINIINGAPIPHLTFLFDCDSTVCFNRANKRNQVTGGKPIFSTSPDKIAVLRKRYLSLADLCPEIKIIKTDRPIKEVTDDILLTILGFLK